VQSLQDDHRQRGSVPPTPPEALQPGERERRPSGVSHVVHHMQADARVGHRGEGARALPPVAAQGTRGRVRQLQPVQAVGGVAVRRLQPGQEQRGGTVSGLRRGVRRFRRAATPPDHRPQEAVPLFQVQGKRDIITYGVYPDATAGVIRRACPPPFPFFFSIARSFKI